MEKLVWLVFATSFCHSIAVLNVVPDFNQNVQNASDAYLRNISLALSSGGYAQLIRREELLQFDTLQQRPLDYIGGSYEEYNEYTKNHLRYAIASTAEQPDSGGHTSNLNIWLTVLIAAVAAAILS